MSQTVIVLEEDCILAAEGREGRYPALSKVKRIELHRQGDSFAEWQQALSLLKEKWNTETARLVLPANLCSTRVLSLPYGRGRQLALMAAKEIADSFRNETADYSVVHSEKKNGVELCGGGADPGTLECLLEICSQAGIAVSGITVPLEGSLRILQNVDKGRGGTAVYLFFEGEGMTSILCQNGRHLYSTRSRLFSEPGTLDFGTEIVRSISGILQFYAGSRRDLKITKVYYAGCPEEDFSVSVEGIKNLGLDVAPMEVGPGIRIPAGTQVSDWLPCIGAMTRGSGGKRIDLYGVFLESGKNGQACGSLSRHLLLPAMVFLICAALTGGVWVWGGMLQRQVASLQDWIWEDGIQQSYQKAKDLEEQLLEIQGAIAAAERTEENLSVYPELSSAVLERLEAVGGSQVDLQVSGYDAETGVLTFRAGSPEVIDIPSYIEKLRDTGLFHTVDYTGYSYDNEWYTLSLSCTMEGEVSERARAEGGNRQ